MRRLVGILFLLVAGLPYALMQFAGDSPPPPPPGAEVLRVVSPHRREVKIEYERGFRAWMRREHAREVDLRWVDVRGASNILKYLESQFASNPGAVGVDIMFGGGPVPFEKARERGWSLPVRLDPDVLSAVPPRCAGLPVYDPGGHWYGVALSGFGILYSRPLLERFGLPEPKDWQDLARPEYFSWVGSGDPRFSGSVHVCYELILQAYGFTEGWGVITRLCANVRSFGQGGGAAPREVAAGEVAAGMVIDQYAQTVIDEVGDGLIAFVLPERGTIISPDPIGLIRGARDPELARQFVEYVLSRPGQKLLYLPAGTGGQEHSLHRRPVRADLYRDDPLAPKPDPYAFKVEFQYDDQLMGRRWRLLNDMVGVCLIDAHAELAAAWKAVIDAGLPQDLVEELCAPPFPQSEAEDYIEALGDSRRRVALTGAWAAAVRERYRKIAQKAAGRQAD